MNIVEQIYTQIKVQVQDELGPGFKELARLYDIEENDFRSIKNAFGVRHGEASSASSVTRSYTMDQRFELLLATNVITRSSDSEIQDAINDLYDSVDQCLTRFFDSKLALPHLVLIVDAPLIQAPQVLPNGAVLLSSSFNVKYRRAIA